MPLFNSSVKHYYVIEGDLQSYFDTVHHRTLMKLLRRRLKDRALLDLLWKFLKSGVMEGGLFERTDSGVPQGGVISPLLANVYLNEFDQWATAQWDLDPSARRRRRRAGRGNFKMVRYADDFVVVGNGTKAEVKATKAALQQFLENELHLTLSEEKTVITHVNDGFDFLGFHIQRKHVNGRWAVHLRPTAKAKERVKRKLKALTSRNWTWMGGWAGYYRYTSFVRDIGEITEFAWFRYLYWLREKHQAVARDSLSEANPRSSMAEPAGMLRCAKAVTRWKRTNGSPPDRNLTVNAIGGRGRRASRIPTCPATQRRRATIHRGKPAQMSGSTRQPSG